MCCFTVCGQISRLSPSMAFCIVANGTKQRSGNQVSARESKQNSFISRHHCIASEVTFVGREFLCTANPSKHAFMFCALFPEFGQIYQ